MLRRPFCGMAAGFLLGILTAAYRDRMVCFGTIPLILGLCAVLLVCTASGHLCVQVKVRIALCLLMFLAGHSRYLYAAEIRAGYEPYLRDGMQLSVQGKLAGKQFQNDQYIYELISCVAGFYEYDKSNSAPVPCERILVYSDSDVSSIGEILVLDGTVKLWERAVNEGGFDAASFYQARGTAFRLTDVKLIASYGKKSKWQEGLFALRLRLKQVYQNVMEADEGGIVTTMVLGDKELLKKETKRLYQEGGLSHILAISGLHISVTGMALYRLLRRGGLGFVSAGICAGVLVCAYGTMAGMGVSVQRAVLMFALLLFSYVPGRSYDTLNALGTAALFLLWKNPFLFGDAGFRFSFAAIAGVAWVGNSVIFTDTHFGKLGQKLFAGLAVQLATLPLVAWYYYEIPLYAMALNLLVLPVVGVILALGIIGGCVGLVSQTLSVLFLIPCSKLLRWCSLLCGVFTGLPGAVQMTGRPQAWRVAVYYLLLAAGTLYAYRRQERGAGRQEQSSGRMQSVAGERSCAGRQGKPLWGTQGGVSMSDACRRAAVLAAAVLSLIAVLLVPARRGFELDMLDVGQGDACFIRTGQGNTIFVDGGSSNVKNVGEYRILPFLKYHGVKKIDCWFVSHADADHISGLAELFELGYPIERLVFSREIVRDAAQQELAGLADAAGAQVLYVSEGEVLHIGQAKVHAIFPPKHWMRADRNASSLVVWYEEADFSGILTGDIGSEEERRIAEWMQRERKTWSDGAALDGQVDFFKAAHHGSNDSNSEELLNLLSPKIAVVSCSGTNRYGHPGQDAVAHMEEACGAVFYTMEGGQIKIRRGEDGILVQKYLNPRQVYVFAD